jgi:N-methylhydantoinase A
MRTTVPVGNGLAFLKRSGLDPKSQRFEFAFQGRYLYQSWDIEVPFDLPDGKLGRGALAGLLAAFHAQHERIYTIKDEGDTVEFTTWKVRAIGDTGGKARRGAPLPAQRGKIQAKSSRKIYLGSGFRDVPVYDASLIGSGAKLAGPAVLELPTTTILLLENQKERIDGRGNILIDLPPQ